MRKRRKLVKKLNKTSHQETITTIKNKLLEVEHKLQLSHKYTEEFNERKAVSAIRDNTKYFYSHAKKTQQDQG